MDEISNLFFSECPKGTRGRPLSAEGVKRAQAAGHAVCDKKTREGRPVQYHDPRDTKGKEQRTSTRQKLRERVDKQRAAGKVLSGRKPTPKQETQAKPGKTGGEGGGKDMGKNQRQDAVSRQEHIYSKVKSLSQGKVPISLDDLYSEVVKADPMSPEMFHLLLLDLEKNGVIGLVSEYGRKPLENQRLLIPTQRGMLGYVGMPEQKKKEIIHSIIDKLVKHKTVVAFADIYKKLKEKIDISWSDFEDFMREAGHKNWRIERASSRQDKGGIFIDGVYYYYVTGKK